MNDTHTSLAETVCGIYAGIFIISFIVCAVIKDFLPSFLPSVGRPAGRAVGRAVGRSVVRSFVRSFVRWVGQVFMHRLCHSALNEIGLASGDIVFTAGAFGRCFCGNRFLHKGFSSRSKARNRSI